MLAAVAELALATVADKRATFTRSNVFAEVLRQLHGVRFATAEDRIAVADTTVALSLDQALSITSATRTASLDPAEGRDPLHHTSDSRRRDPATRARPRHHRTHRDPASSRPKARFPPNKRPRSSRSPLRGGSSMSSSALPAPARPPP